ncbi:MAG: YicC family protein [Clostridia bacterium]|nr:YicC family protein [Clostridia bacterium]
MIKSMTGFGRHQATVNGLEIQVEIRSVNHRYFEFSARVPHAYGYLDGKLKAFLQEKIARGKVDIGVWITATDTDGCEVTVNRSLAKAYYRALTEVREVLAEEDPTLRGELSVLSVAKMPDVMTLHAAQLDEELVWNSVREVAEIAVDRFLTMRETEGARLREDVLSRADTILEYVSFVEERAPQTVKERMEKIENRMRELLDGVAVDESRLLTEAGLLADRLAVDEETVRLRSHIAQLKQMVCSDEAIGRKLDFLVQEINRETNTIASKSQDVDLAKTAVNMKSEIEKIREQIQNIE